MGGWCRAIHMYIEYNASPPLALPLPLHLPLQRGHPFPTSAEHLTCQGSCEQQCDQGQQGIAGSGREERWGEGGGAPLLTGTDTYILYGVLPPSPLPSVPLPLSSRLGHTPPTPAEHLRVPEDAYHSSGRKQGIVGSTSEGLRAKGRRGGGGFARCMYYTHDPSFLLREYANMIRESMI